MTEFDQLWRQLLDRLDRHGLLGPRSTNQTPAEIARSIQFKADDLRVHTFVWNYYYPNRYGEVQGCLTTEQAKNLVDSYSQPSSSDRPKPIRSEGRSKKPQARRCKICGVRRPEIDEDGAL
ncbi:MAG: hypothetical protein P4L46_05390 [Fimbriimonas sp.]|nr:hypothetical protein [Fimbriimonas sp.]